jgi:quinol monooxygenase YgiN/catechol 2,3-dioxygenase-like lactoylglutathione lyase family enzyme
VITVTATQTVKPGREEELDLLMSALTADIKENEPGCERFDYVRTEASGRRRLVIEQYRDETALEIHRQSPYLRRFIPKLLQVLEEPPTVTTYREVVPVRSTPSPSFFHTGVVVPDLEKAVARYSDVFGISFTEPAVFEVPRLEDPDPHPFRLTAVFSRTEAPYFELIQAEGSGIVAAEHGERILYYGVWESDMAGRIEKLSRQGIRIDARFRADADSTPFALITAPDPVLGARIEYVDTADRGPIEEWVRTGRYPGGVGTDR